VAKRRFPSRRAAGGGATTLWGAAARLAEVGDFWRSELASVGVAGGYALVRWISS